MKQVQSENGCGKVPLTNSSWLGLKHPFVYRIKWLQGEFLGSLTFILASTARLRESPLFEGSLQ